MNKLIVFTEIDLKRMKAEIVGELGILMKKANTPSKWMKSAEVREMLGGISAAKLQSLRVSGLIPGVNADGLWLYCYDDIINYLESNKTDKKEGNDE
jgi:hypothetical protein